MLKYNLPGIYYLIVAFVFPYVGSIIWANPSCLVTGDFYACRSGSDAIILLIITVTSAMAIITQIIIWFTLIVVFFRRLKHKEEKDSKSLIPAVLQYFIIGSAIIVGVLSLVVYFLSKV